jgi:hypothetical protein
VTCEPSAPTATEEYVAGWFWVYKWTYSGCTPDLFHIQVSTSSQFLSIYREATVPGDEHEWHDDGDYSYGVIYYWRVRGLAGSNVGPWSNVRSFGEVPH